MLFNSYSFLFVFLPLLWILFRLSAALKFFRTAIFILVVGSLFFYAYWSLTHLALIAFSILFNYFWTKYIVSKGDRRRWKLLVGVGANLALLGYFKYTGFIVANLEALTGANLNVGEILLPLGISFFTFQQIAYQVDCHRGVTGENRFVDYALFVSFFPQLIAGPIVHHSEMMKQFRQAETFQFDFENLSKGATLFTAGLFKKAIIADTLSPWAIALFEGSGNPGAVAAWTGAIAYCLQIYFDFSGYSDMALGLGRVFNIKLPVNFDSPYKARNIVDFWRRWHITLSRFLRDYLYIPLGGNRHGTPRRYVNLMATMLLGGLWHGAAWTFVLWGGLHGLLLCINHAWVKVSDRFGIRIPGTIAWLTTFLSVTVAWVFFRAPTLGRARAILKGMFGQNGMGLENGQWFQPEAFESYAVFTLDAIRLPLLLLLVLFCVLAPTGWRWAYSTQGKKMSVLSAIGTAAMFVCATLSLTRISEFLYFQF